MFQWCLKIDPNLRGKTEVPRMRPVVKKLWVDGRAGEDREEWMEEVEAHCERCCDDQDKTSQVQAERIREQRCRGDTWAAWQGRKEGN